MLIELKGILLDNGNNRKVFKKDLDIHNKHIVYDFADNIIRNKRIIGGWDYVEITGNYFKSKRFLNEELNRDISLLNNINNRG